MSKDGAEIDSGFEGRRRQRGSEVSGWGGGDVRAVGVGTGIHGRLERSELGGDFEVRFSILLVEALGKFSRA